LSKGQTTRLVHYGDTDRHCWSRVDLASGEPIYISIAASGIVVKRSQLGFFGARLYKETMYRAAITAKALDAQYKHYSTPEGMTNPALRAFTQAALNSNTAAEFLSLVHAAVRLSEAPR
jgi:hypothetical protein